MGGAARIFIDGEAGTTGLGIRDRLRALPGIALHSLGAAERKDPVARRAMMAEVDLVILCLPDAAARESVALADSLGAAAPRILDASTAFRVAPDWTYGFAELAEGQPARIAAAPRVANPGCYPTGAIALLRPLVAAGILPADHPVCINAVTGYSGGGRGMIEAHETTGGPAFELYGLGLTHKHVPEIMVHAQLVRRPIFVPSVGHFPQGMLVSIPLHLDQLPGAPDADALRAALAAQYRASDLVSVEPGGAALDPQALAGTDCMVLRVHAHHEAGHAVLTAQLDNLGKGASGAAVQNATLMLGLAQELARRPAAVG